MSSLPSLYSPTERLSTDEPLKERAILNDLILN
jgi:hypothetical protein